MSKTGTRKTNGEGYVGSIVAKHKRKKFLDTECSICKKCTDRSACNNRIGYEKCQKCKDCKTECLKYCDRFRCYAVVQVQITIDGKQTTVANSKTKKDAVEKKKNVEAEVITNNYVRKNGVTLSQKIRKILRRKLKSNEINGNTYVRNLDNLAHIEKSNIGNIPMQKLNKDIIEEFMNTKVYLSQSFMSQIFDLIKLAFSEAIDDGEISERKNPIKKVKIPISNKEIEEVIPFEIHEEVALLEYITKNQIITFQKNSYDNNTMKNIIILGLFTGMRIGEIGALNIDENINLEEKYFKIKNTLSKDENRNVIIGNTTKTGKKKKRQNKADYRIIPFGIFDEKIVESIVKEQIEISKNNPHNKNNLLFCRKDGKFIHHSQITNIFKRICRDAKIKLDLPKGCHIHMTRHTFTTRCIEAGMDLMVIAKLLGHSSTAQIEKTYGHILDKYINRNLDELRNYYEENKLLTASLRNLLLTA